MTCVFVGQKDQMMRKWGTWAIRPTLTACIAVLALLASSCASGDQDVAARGTLQPAVREAAPTVAPEQPTSIPATSVPPTAVPARATEVPAEPTVVPPTAVPAAATEVPAEPTAPSATEVPNDAATPEPVVEEPTAEPDADPSPGRGQLIENYTLIGGANDDLGSGSPEFSGVTYNVDLNRLLVVEDGDRIFEFDLGADGQPIAPPRRTLRISVGGGDNEGIAWLGGERYGLAAENFGLVNVVDLSGDIEEVLPEHLVHQIETGISEDSGAGLEGFAWASRDTDTPAVWAVKEKPPTLRHLGWDGALIGEAVLDIGIRDVSDIAVLPDGSLLVLSDESHELVQLEVNADLSSVVVLSRFELTGSIGWFAQPEGLAVDPSGTRVWVASENPGPTAFSLALITGPAA